MVQVNAASVNAKPLSLRLAQAVSETSVRHEDDAEAQGTVWFR